MLYFEFVMDNLEKCSCRIHRRNLVNRRHVIPGIWKLAKDVVRSCPDCQRTKLQRQPKSALKSMPLPIQKWHTIRLDWIEGLHASGSAQHDSLLVVVDSGTRLTHLIPTHKSSSSMNVAQLLLQHVFRLHGFPRVTAPIVTPE